MSGTPPVLELRGVTRVFHPPGGAVAALRDAELALPGGDFLMVTGPSGSGKTTLLNLCALLDAPTAGQVLFDGRDAGALPEEERCALRARAVGMVFQRFCLLPHRSALENVAFRFRYASAPADEARARAECALREVGLWAQRERPARLLSAGEMQRVAIARAVALRPRLLLADEPTGNLDAAAAAAVMEILAALHQGGLTILMATHNETLLRYATRRAQCREGLLRAG